MKIGIVTVYDSIVNYGSFLQAYALSAVLEERGHDTYFIRRMDDDDILNRFNQLAIKQNTVKNPSSIKSQLLKIKFNLIAKRELENNNRRFEACC